MGEFKIAFRETGSGAPLLLLHGYAGTVLHWDQVISPLSKKFRVIALNLNHLYLGKKPLKFSEQVEILAKFLREHFPKEKVHMAGISYGGALLWGVALKYPELVDKTIFINPMPPKPVDSFNMPILKSFFRLPLNMKMIYMILRTPMGKMFLKNAASVFRIERAEFWEHQGKLNGRKLLVICQVIHRFAYILRNENWNAWVDRIEAWVHPSMLIFDYEDTLFTPKTYHRFQELIGCDEVREIHLAGHIATQTRGPEIADMVLEFLNEKSKIRVA